MSGNPRVFAYRWIVAAMVVLAGLWACTETDVEVTETFEIPTVDDQLEISGEVCTEAPDDSHFPVKIMFIMDCSGSMQQTDEGDHRVEAVRDVIRRYSNNPQISFDVIKFNGRVSDLTSGFTQLTGDDERVFGAQGIVEADSMTDYQGGLGVAYQTLLNDMMTVANGAGGLPELTRTKYVIIFFSDGTPDPVCYGCVTDPPNHPRYSPECHDDLHVVCTLMDEIVLDMDYAEPGMFPGLEGGADYNHPYQLQQLVEAIMDLKRTFNVGELRFHTAFLYCRDQFGNPTSSLCAAAEAAYNLDPDRGRKLLGDMARWGNGTFRDFTSGQDINFLRIDYTNIKRSYELKNLMATNINAFPGYDHFLPDSDGDGLDDDSELRDGTDPLLADSDDDGYSDFIEKARSRAGYDPMDSSRPDEPCTERQDSDGDGLCFCEEQLYRTDDKLVDTDADGFPDLYEIRFGTDPLVSDATGDLDSDGHRNADELLFHSHPGRADPTLYDDHRYWYELTRIEDENQDEQCHSFNIRHISLVTTKDRDPDRAASKGYNDILIWFNQSSYDDPLDPGLFRVACVRAQYIAPDYKIPWSGKVTLTDQDFKSPYELDLSFTGSDCVTGTEQE